MIITPSNYLDFGSIFLNEVIGSVTLALLLGYVVIVFLSIRVNIPFYAMVGLLILWSGLIISWAANSLLLFLIVLGVGGIGYSMLRKFINR